VNYTCNTITSHGKIIKAKQTKSQPHLFSTDIKSRLGPNLSPAKISGSHFYGKLLPVQEGTAGAVKEPLQPREARNCSDFHQGCSASAQEVC